MNKKKDKTKLEIIHLQQVHRIGELPYEEIDEKTSAIIVKSQFLLAGYILKHPGVPVVNEEVFSIDCVESPGKCKSLKEKIFPNGLPERFNELTLMQKKFLYYYGGAEILASLGLIPKIYKSMEAKSLEKINKELVSGDMSNAIDFREKCAIEQVEKVAKELNADKVILVYGAGHDFSKEASKHNHHVTEIKFQVVTDYMNIIDKILEGKAIIAFGHKTFNYKNLTLNLKNLIDWLPEGTRKLLSSDYVSTSEIESLVEESFSKTYKIIKEDKLLDYIVSGELPVDRVFSVYDSADINDNLWCPERAKQLYNQMFIYLTNQDLETINPFIDLDDLDLNVSENLSTEIIGLNYQNLELNTL